MLSRVANAIYWMSRYVERADNVARFIDVNLHLTLDLPPGTAVQWQPLIDATGDGEDFDRRYGQTNKDQVIRFLAFDPDNANSILSSLRTARANARGVRNSISTEMWEQMNKFYLMVQAAAADDRTTPTELFRTMKEAGHLFLGITDATMSHGEGWHFARLGRLLERADKTSRILDVKCIARLPKTGGVEESWDELHWSVVLRSASALEMYRKRHGRVRSERAAEFLFLDREFPRAIRFCLHKAEQSLRAISGTAPGAVRNPAEEQLGRLGVEVADLDVQRLLQGGMHEFLDDFQRRLNLVGSAIYDTFFALRPVANFDVGRPMVPNKQ